MINPLSTKLRSLHPRLKRLLPSHIMDHPPHHESIKTFSLKKAYFLKKKRWGGTHLNIWCYKLNHLSVK